jgi:CubicO group peptidase (beta-lactamase class C family)
MAILGSIRELLERGIRAGAAPGLVAGWQRIEDREPSLVAVGRASIGPPSRDVGRDAWFDLASLTKPLVVGTLAAQVLREGRLELHTEIADILPEIESVPLGSRSVRQLLCHTSGLPAWEPLYALAASNRDDDVLASLGALELGPPDEHVVYSCPGYVLLGLLLRRIIGSHLDEALARQVLDPLGLAGELGYAPPLDRMVAEGARTPLVERQLLVERGLDPDLVPPISPRRPDDGNARFLDGVSGNSGLFGTARGVLGLAVAWLRTDPVIGPDAVALATSNHTPGLEQARGLGWQLAESPGCSAGRVLDPMSFGHTGFSGTSVWVDPTRQLAVALLSNRVHPAHRPTDLHPLRRALHRVVAG